MAHVLKINGRDIRKPSGFQISSYNLTKSGRVASGLMVMDLVAKKRKFFFTYDIIDSRSMDLILSLIDGSAMFFTLTYEENNRVQTATVYVGEIPRERFRTRDKTTSVWYWKNFNFNLIEQ